MPDNTPDPIPDATADARLRQLAQSSLAAEAAMVDTEADLATLQARLAGEVTPSATTSSRPAPVRWLAAAAAAVLVIGGIVAIAWTRTGGDGDRVAPPPASPTPTGPAATRAVADPSVVVAGGSVTITPANVVERNCADIVTARPIDWSAPEVGLLVGGRWHFDPSGATKPTYPPCVGETTADPLTLVIPTDMPEGRWDLCVAVDRNPASCATVTVVSGLVTTTTAAASGWGSAVPAVVVPGSSLTITPAEPVDRECPEVITAIQLDNNASNFGLIVNGRWQSREPLGPPFRYPSPEPCRSSAEPASIAVPFDFPTGLFALCVNRQETVAVQSTPDPGCATVTVEQAPMETCWTEPVPPPTLTDGSAPGELSYNEHGWASWGAVGSNEVQQWLHSQPNPWFDGRLSWWFDDPTIMLPHVASGPIRAAIGAMSDNPAVPRIVLVRGADGCDRTYLLPETSDEDAQALAQAWVAALADTWCRTEPIAPPSLVDGAAPGEPVFETWGGGQAARWGDADSPNAVRHPFGVEPDPQWLDAEVAAGRAITTDRFQATAIPVGDPPLGMITIFVRDLSSDCLLQYLVGPGLLDDEAEALAQAWVNALVSGEAPAGPGHDSIGTEYFGRRPTGTGLAPFFEITRFSGDGTESDVLGPDEVGALFPSGALPDGSLVGVAGEHPQGRCENLPIVRRAEGEVVPFGNGSEVARTIAVAPDGTVFVTRDICPQGRWGDPGTRHELVLFTEPNNPAAVPQVLVTRESDPGAIQFNDGEVIIALGELRVEHVSPDGRYVVVREVFNPDQSRFHVVDRQAPGGFLTLPSSCDYLGDMVAPPRWADATTIVVARLCAEQREADVPSDALVGIGSGPVHIEAVDQAAGTVTWTASVPSVGPHGHSRTAGLSARRSDDGSVQAILTAGGDIERSGQTFALHGEEVVEITRAGYSELAFDPAELIHWWDARPDGW
ncbi:MAG TPA: hypothetical protein VNQ73_01935 [Ilumatobacter sp.]|nr:hypothetical protein [Ilumatobacter sp.]